MQLIREPTTKRSPLAAFAALVLFGGAFFGAARVVERTATPEIDVLPNKWGEFTREPGRFNTAILGSSHVYHQIDPAAFDRVCGERGITTRSFNLGMPGWATFQLNWMVRRVIASNQGVKYIVIDAENVQFEINPRNVRVRQTIAWHDIPLCLHYLRTMFAADLKRKKEWEYVSLHALPAAYNFCAFGVLQVPLSNWLNNRSAETLARSRAGSNGPSLDGFRDYTQMLKSTDAKSRENLLAGVKEFATGDGRARYEKEVAGIAKQVVAGDLRPEARVALGELQRICDEAGVTVVFVTSPVVFTMYADTVRAAREGVIKHLLYFTDPKKYPELYAFENQFDNRHLNAEGAQIYTRLIGEGFADIVKPAGAGAASTGLKAP